MSPSDNRWAEVARDADLSDDDLVALSFVYASVTESTTLADGQLNRAARRIWVEAQRPASGTLPRRFLDLVVLGRSQVRLFGLPFWLVSLTVMLAGGGAAAVMQDPGRAVAFYLAGPLLAYVATAAAFRGQGRSPQEIELSTPVSARELLVVRLFLILVYDVLIGLVASLPLAIAGLSSLAAITMAWFGPLLLMIGATLLGTSWMRVEHAGAITYATWVAAVVGTARLALAPASVLTTIEFVMVVLGVALLAVVVVALPGRFQLSRGPVPA